MSGRDLSLFEYEDLRRKLNSKAEALLILTKELEETRNQRDKYQSILSSLTDDRVQQGIHPLGLKDGGYEGHLIQLRDIKDENRRLKKAVEQLSEQLNEAQGDSKVLRQQLHKTKSSEDSHHSDDRERLVEQIERTNMKVSQLERDLSAILDEKEELVGERDSYKSKVQRLNTEMNILLTGDDKKLIDIDALLMENKYLQERLKHTQEEKSLAMQTLTKYKNLVERKRNKSGGTKDWNRVDSSLLVTHKQVESVLENRSLSTVNVAELRSLCLALLDSLRDKNLELSHQKKANKILGSRVTELEERVEGPCSSTLVAAIQNKLEDDTEEAMSKRERLPSSDLEDSLEQTTETVNILKLRDSVSDQDEKSPEGDTPEELPPHLQKLFKRAMQDLASPPYQEQR